ncbi:fibronectin type III domain-containing protein [Scandinavium goeteborgense]|uniref:fibronectin type III domain-containing protein n=1 Tax=Scandinavium goeteborgense TaxID=1851514 RepID=UPI00382F1948
MADPINVKFVPSWGSTSEWYAELDIKMTNNTGAALESPINIKIDLAQAATASSGSGFTVLNDTTPSQQIVGLLDQYLTPLANGASVNFSLGLSLPNGGFDPSLLPTGYWVNGQPANGTGPSPDNNAPTAPTNLHSTAATSSSITLNWTASTDDEGVAGYAVVYSSNSVTQHQLATTTTATLLGLSANTRYSIYVLAYDAARNVSTPSSTIEVLTPSVAPDTTPPTVPQNLVITGTQATSVSLSWAASTDTQGIKNYLVQYATQGGENKTASFTGTNGTITGLTPNTTYTFSVAAVDNSNNQSAFSASKTTTTTATPVAGKVAYAPYIDVTLYADWSTEPAKINTDFISGALSRGVTKFHFAFLALASQGSKQVVWGNSSFPLTSIQPAVNLIKSKGGEAIFAFGGQMGIDPSTTYTIDELADLYVSLATTYGIRTIDLDFETQSYYKYQVAFPAALKAKTQVPDLVFSLTLPVLPEGLTEEGKTMISYAKNIGLDIYVMIMAMDYGESYPSNMGNNAVQAITSTKNQLKAIYPSKSDQELYGLIGVTPMIGQNDVSTEFFTLADVKTVTDFAKANSIYQVAAWSLDRDFPLGTDPYGNDHEGYNESTMLKQDPFEFSENFVQHLSS